MGLAQKYCWDYINNMSSNNVQFSVAVHIMQVLCVHSNKKVVSSFITESVNTDAGTVRTVLSKLAKAGLVLTTRGRGGSSALARTPDQISLLDIYRAVTSQTVFLIHTHPVEQDCIVSSHHKQTMCSVLADCQRTFEASLSDRKLADVVGPMLLGGG